MLRIFIDDREKILIDIFSGLNFESEVLRLPIGDLFIVSDSGGLIVERKTPSDFFSSLTTNRLWDQLVRLSSTDEMLNYPVVRRLLLIHGCFKGFIWRLYPSKERKRDKKPPRFKQSPKTPIQ